MVAKVIPLGLEHLDALKALLLRDPTHNLYLLGLLDDYGISRRADQPPFVFYGRFVESTLVAALFVGGDGGLVIPSSGHASEIAELAAELTGKLTLKSALGDKPAIDVLARQLCPTAPRTSRTERLYAVTADDLGPFTNPRLRPANDGDLQQLLPLAAQATRERLGYDPVAKDAEGFDRAVRHRVRTQRTYVLPHQDRLVFKVDIGARSRYGAELEGLYTLPTERRRGHAVHSLGQISRHLLASLPLLTLRLDEPDSGFAAAAVKVGYVPGKVQRFILYE